MTISLYRRAGAVAAVAALAIAGCGGGDDNGGGGGGDKAAFESATNSFCQSITTAAQQVQKDATSLQGSAAKDPKKAVQALSGALDKFASSTSTALDKFRAAKAPGDYADFHDKAVKGFDTVVSKLRDAAKAAKTGNVQAISALGTSLNGISLPEPPQSLKDKAPACKDIAR
jgi:hypothetical protein